MTDLGASDGNKTGVEDADKEGISEQEFATCVPSPDIGFAWVISICSMAIVFSTWGTNAGYGVFLSYYMSSNSFPEATEYDYALIGGLVLFCAQSLAPFASFIYKVIGFHATCIVGVAIQFLGYILASFAINIWQLYLTQGILVGVAFALSFVPSTILLSLWFEKRLATGMGIAVSGAGLGGIFFSLTVNKMIQLMGDQKWALHMCGLVTLVISLVSCLLMRPRFPEKRSARERFSFAIIKQNFCHIFDINVFKNPMLVLLSLWFGLCLLGYTLMLFLMASYARLVG